MIKNTISFECKRCKIHFSSDVGQVAFSPVDNAPSFEQLPCCPNCGELTTDEVWLTERGQGQLTEIYMNR